MSTRTPRFFARPLTLSAPLLAGLALAGCQSSYSLDVRNTSTQPATLQVLSRNADGAQLLTTRRYGPGDRGSIGPFTLDGREIVWVRATTAPSPERPAELTLRPGLTVLEVTPAGGPSDPVRLRELGGTKP
jgi:hypothetical protein